MSASLTPSSCTAQSVLSVPHAPSPLLRRHSSSSARVERLPPWLPPCLPSVASSLSLASRLDAAFRPVSPQVFSRLLGLFFPSSPIPLTIFPLLYPHRGLLPMFSPLLRYVLVCLPHHRDTHHSAFLITSIHTSVPFSPPLSHPSSPSPSPPQRTLSCSPRPLRCTPSHLLSPSRPKGMLLLTMNPFAALCLQESHAVYPYSSTVGPSSNLE